MLCGIRRLLTRAIRLLTVYNDVMVAWHLRMYAMYLSPGLIKHPIHKENYKPKEIGDIAFAQYLGTAIFNESLILY